MKLQKREKFLLSAVLGLVVAVGVAVFFMTGDSQSDDYLLKERDELSAELQKKKKEKKAAEDDAKQLVDWRARSLPSDLSIARSRYEVWLGKLSDTAGLRNFNIHSDQSSSVNPKAAYTRVPFTIRATANNVKQIVSFLYHFYSANQLQQIRSFDIKPASGSKSSGDFDLHISVEAISLPDATAKDNIDTQPRHVLRLAQQADYENVIGKRNFFAVYTPPTPPDNRIGRGGGGGVVIVDPPRVKTLDLTKFAIVTGIRQVDGTMWVWLTDRLAGAGKVSQLREGDSFKVDGKAGQIRKIDPAGKVLVQFNGETRRIGIGDSLRDGVEVKE
jgi:hypothetical protein